MQTDLWLTETSDYDKCPLCSRLLKRGTQTCYACGFSNETPSVWIDPTARAYNQTVTPHTTRDLTPDPQASSPVWQYDSPDFEAAGSLPMLSMFMPETPTQPQPPVPNRSTTRRLPDIDEIDTVPPRAQAAMLPPARGQEQRALVIAPQSAPAETGSRSWTAGAASGSPSAQLIARFERRKRLLSVHPFHPLDEARWWLLRPGRIEFILWLGGTLLLIGVTCLLLLVSALSFQWFAPSAPSIPLASSAYGNNAQQRSISSNSNGGNPSLALVGAKTIIQGQPYQLSGRGFKPSLVLIFYFDGKVPLLNQDQQAARVPVDSSGTFQTTLWLGTNSSWATGWHIIAVQDAAGTPLTAIQVRLVSGSDNTNTSTIASTSSTPVTTPGGNNTGSSTPAGPQGTPVSRPPVTATPTKTPVLSPTPKPTVSPTVSPTVKPSPTISPTVKPSPTPVTSPVGGTPPAGFGHTAANSGLGNALNDSGASPTTHLASVSPLVWIMVACYLLSMFCLGAAGFMHRRHNKIVM